MSIEERMTISVRWRSLRRAQKLCAPHNPARHLEAGGGAWHRAAHGHTVQERSFALPSWAMTALVASSPIESRILPSGFRRKLEGDLVPAASPKPHNPARHLEAGVGASYQVHRRIL
jgi:hypothetical protein